MTLITYAIGPPIPEKDPARSVETFTGPGFVGVGNITKMDSPIPVSVIVHTGMFDPRFRPVPCQP